MSYLTGYKKALLLILGACGVSAQSSLYVIADRGGESAIRFYEIVKPVDMPHISSPHAIASKVGEEDILPIKSHRMKVCKLTTREHKLPTILYPLVLVGSDEVSLKWLRALRGKLKERNAVGLVVSAHTPADLKRVREAGAGIDFIPVWADDIAKHLNISCYPVIIDRSIITQSLS